MDHPYILDNTDEYKITILHILRSLNNDIKNIIFDKLLMNEILELMTQQWYDLAELSDLEEENTIRYSRVCCSVP